MELSSSIFSDILSPLAIYQADVAGDSEGQIQKRANNSPSVPLHIVQARADCGTAGKSLDWRLDGGDIDGTRFFAVPTFAIGTPPLRVDVYIPPPEQHSNHVRHVLKPEMAMYTTDKQSALDLPISKHLRQALDYWSSSLPAFKTLYLSLPFGSQIVVEELSIDPIATAATIHLVPNYAVEQAMASLDDLRQIWRRDIQWPATIDTTSLSFRSQIHEAITLVTIPSSADATREYVFKSLLRDQKYLYNELKMLLTLPPHPNIISRPVHIVTHKCRFGGKRGVAGFILEYYPLGSLAAYLSSPSTSLSDRFRWARQITSALAHVNQAGAFYPDLKPDNIVLRQAIISEEEGGCGCHTDDAVLLDLEQRGGWFSWSPPEVAYAEYLEILAARAPDDAAARAAEFATALRGYYAQPDCAPQPVRGKGDEEKKKRYADHSPPSSAENGFSAPWLALARLRDGGAGRGGGGTLATLLERAQSFMLGKLLWCVFEGRSVVRCGVDHELLRDPDPEHAGARAFPEFAETPDAVRGLIRACTAGAAEWEGKGRGLVLRRGSLVPAAWDGEGDWPGAGETAEIARLWWTAEVEAAKQFLGEITAVEHGEKEVAGGVLGDAMKRPLLKDVLDQLTLIEEGIL